MLTNTYTVKNGILRRVIERACELTGLKLPALTVMSDRSDPYRLDTPARHRDGAWLAQQLEIGFPKGKKTHWRGLHYYLITRKVQVVKPDGSNFLNTEENWDWLVEDAGKAARWLGYIEFDRIVDRRNAPPVIHRRPRELPGRRADASLYIDLPDHIGPVPVSCGFIPRQPFQLVLYGEKSSLEEVAAPIAERHEADLYLVTGEISDAYLHQIASDAANDPDHRPLIVITLTDADPSGWQMAISIARKLQGLKDLFFPHLKFEVVRAGLTIEQVRRLGLPSTPLKKGDKRAKKWKEAFGIEQTEIDALTTPERMDDLRQIIEAAFKPYFDYDLERRVANAKKRWEAKARAVIDAQVDKARLEDARARAEEVRAEIASLNTELEEIATEIELPAFKVPQPKVDLDPGRQALVKLDQDWVEVTEGLIADRAYDNGE